MILEKDASDAPCYLSSSEASAWASGFNAARDIFAPMLAEKERTEPGYRISEPDDGWRVHGSFSADEKAKLRPIAETLAMLDGNAFFGNEGSAGAEWYEQYLPEAHALYEGNGGDSGWAGEASFAKPEARALAAEAALAAERERIAASLDAQANALWERCETKRTDPPSIDEQADAAQAFALQKAAAAIRAEGE